MRKENPNYLGCLNRLPLPAGFPSAFELADRITNGGKNLENLPDPDLLVRSRQKAESTQGPISSEGEVPQTTDATTEGVIAVDGVDEGTVLMDQTSDLHA